MATLQTPFLTDIMTFVTNIGGMLSLSILSAALLTCSLIIKKRYNAILLIFSMGGGLIITESLKEWFARPRPENAIIETTDFSFPSGHSTMSIIFFSLLLYSFKDDIENKYTRALFVAANIGIFLLIGFSRIYLNVHYLSDVIAGFSFGLFWLTLLILFFKVTIFFAKLYKRRLYRPHHE
jgi:undecaprenyl-diphosphatase